MAAGTRGPGDFLVVHLAISRAILILEEEVSGRSQPLAIWAALELGNRRREAPEALWAGGIRLETPTSGRCPRRLTPGGTRWAAGGIPSGT